jgi:hypothetical protein
MNSGGSEPFEKKGTGQKIGLCAVMLPEFSNSNFGFLRTGKH